VPSPGAKPPGARSPRLLAAAVLAASLTLGSASTAGLAAAEEQEPPVEDPLARILAHEQQLERRSVGLVRLRASYPQLVSGALGVMRVRQPADYDCTTVCDYRGLILAIEPGLGGIQLGAGWATVVGDKKRNERFLSDVYVGFGVRGVVLQTWGAARLEPRDQTFAGVEGNFTIASTSFSLGLTRGLYPAPGEKRWLVTGGLGWGF
jgi:hypothetical protein